MYRIDIHRVFICKVNPRRSDLKAKIHYDDIGDYLCREEKLPYYHRNRKFFS